MSADGKVWILAAVLLLAAPLSGCAGDGDGTQSAEDDANPGTENETTDPGDTGNENEETDQAENEETEPERGDHDGWSMAGHDAARTNYAVGETGPTGALSETWSTDHDLYEAVTDGLVLAADDEGTLVALATGNGVPVWDTDLAVESEPAVADGTIYAFVDADEVALVALDAETGEEQWRVAADVASDTPWRSSNPPPVGVDGTIVSHEGSTVVARDAGTGEVSWNYTTEDRVSVAAADGTVVAAVRKSPYAISAVDLESGDESWTHEFPYNMDESPSRPVVAHGHVYVTLGDDGLYAFDLESGEESWTFEAEDDVNTPAVDEDHVYVGSGVVEKAGGPTSDYEGPFDTRVYALDGETGEEVWRYDAGSRVSGAPIVTEAQVYASAGGALHAIEIASGEGTTISESDDRAIVPGVVVDGTVFGDDAAFTDS
jgi:outer membrane protein assembly factor BamB